MLSTLQYIAINKEEYLYKSNNHKADQPAISGIARPEVKDHSSQEHFVKFENYSFSMVIAHVSGGEMIRLRIIHWKNKCFGTFTLRNGQYGSHTQLNTTYGV